MAGGGGGARGEQVQLGGGRGQQRRVMSPGVFADPFRRGPEWDNHVEGLFGTASLVCPGSWAGTMRPREMPEDKKRGNRTWAESMHMAKGGGGGPGWGEGVDLGKRRIAAVLGLRAYPHSQLRALIDALSSGALDLEDCWTRAVVRECLWQVGELEVSSKGCRRRWWAELQCGGLMHLCQVLIDAASELTAAKWRSLGMLTEVSLKRP